MRPTKIQVRIEDQDRAAVAQDGGSREAVRAAQRFVELLDHHLPDAVDAVDAESPHRAVRLEDHPPAPRGSPPRRRSARGPAAG